VTAIQIVMLALLNDGAILSIAYDNVHYKDQPEAWNMRLVLGMASVLGIVGPIAAFGLFYLGDKVFHLDHSHLQTLMYLTLSVAGHLTIFLARTRRPFWSIRPARILLMAVVGTQIFATLIAVYGVFMTRLGWGYAAVVWGYALAWFLVTDRVKLLAYRILDPGKAEDVVSADTRTREHSSPADLPEKGASSLRVAPFHTDSDEDNPVYHDNSDCPYGQEIKRNDNDKPGADGRRRCDWCTQHA
jgi:H+-transporting ATPase